MLVSFDEMFAHALMNHPERALELATATGASPGARCAELLDLSGLDPQPYIQRTKDRLLADSDPALAEDDQAFLAYFEEKEVHAPN